MADGITVQPITDFALVILATVMHADAAQHGIFRTVEDSVEHIVSRFRFPQEVLQFIPLLPDGGTRPWQPWTEVIEAFGNGLLECGTILVVPWPEPEARCGDQSG